MRMILVAISLLICSEAHAFTTWVTPFVFIGLSDEAWCVVTNLDKKPTFLNTQLIDSAGLPIVPLDSSCGSSLNPGVTCLTAGNDGTAAQCNVVTGTNKVRVALEVVDATGAPKVVVPATK